MCLQCPDWGHHYSSPVSTMAGVRFSDLLSTGVRLLPVGSCGLVVASVDQPSFWVTTNPSCLEEDSQRHPPSLQLTAQLREQLANAHASWFIAIDSRFANSSRRDLRPLGPTYRSLRVFQSTFPRPLLVPLSLFVRPCFLCFLAMLFVSFVFAIFVSLGLPL